MKYTVNGNFLMIEHLDQETNVSNIETETKESMGKCNINSDEINGYYDLLKNSSVDENDSEKFGNFMKLLDKSLVFTSFDESFLIASNTPKKFDA